MKNLFMKGKQSEVALMYFAWVANLTVTIIAYVSDTLKKTPRPIKQWM